MYDLEKLMLDLLAVCQSNLEAKLAQIQEEKGDGVVLIVPPHEAYFFQSVAEEAAPYDAFIYFGMDNPVPVSNGGPYTAQQVEVTFAVMHKKSLIPAELMPRFLRYQRALTEIFEECWSSYGGPCKLSISGLSPTDFELIGSDEIYKGVGVKIKTVIG